MSIEQWGILALVVLLAFLEAVSRRRRTRASHGEPSDRVARAPASGRRLQLPNGNADDHLLPATTHIVTPPSLPPPLPQPSSRPGISLAGQTRPQRPVVGKAVVQWLRPVRNLRRAVVVATILGPPIQ
jgi:hypothetical protein